jgi:hypothetical protein
MVKGSNSKSSFFILAFWGKKYNFEPDNKKGVFTLLVINRPVKRPVAGINEAVNSWDIIEYVKNRVVSSRTELKIREYNLTISNSVKSHTGRGFWQLLLFL